MLRHIALDIIKNDLNEFYLEILKGEIIGQFELSKEDANKIFDIQKPVDVYYVKYEDFELELFIYPNSARATFNHLCVEMSDGQGIYKAARQQNFWTFVRTNNQRETYFIKDKNGNMFELKGKI